MSREQHHQIPFVDHSMAEILYALAEAWQNAKFLFTVVQGGQVQLNPAALPPGTSLRDFLADCVMIFSPAFGENFRDLPDGIEGRAQQIDFYLTERGQFVRAATLEFFDAILLSQLGLAFVGTVLSPNPLQTPLIYDLIVGPNTTSYLAEGDDNANRMDTHKVENFVQAAGGDDTVLAHPDGTGQVDGGAGTDTFSGEKAVASSMSASLSVGSATFGGVGTTPEGTQYMLAGFENLRGTPNADSLTGDGQANRIDGDAGNDRLNGEAGDDTLAGGDGADTLNGGDGNDEITGGATDADLRDVVFGGLGNDRIDAGHGNDQVYGGDGDDTVEGGFGVDEIIGQAGNDVLTGSAFSDLIFGGDGDDFVNGGFGSDRVNGGTGADRFYHLGIPDHGSDWIQDYNAAAGDRLVFGGAGGQRSQFQVNVTETANAGQAGVQEAFVIYRPTGQILWALVDGDAQGAINLQIGGQVFDLLA